MTGMAEAELRQVAAEILGICVTASGGEPDDRATKEQMAEMMSILAYSAGALIVAHPLEDQETYFKAFAKALRGAVEIYNSEPDTIRKVVQ